MCSSASSCTSLFAEETIVSMNLSSLIVVIVRSVSCFPESFVEDLRLTGPRPVVSSACVVLVVGLGHVFLQEVFEVILHRVSEGHTVEFRGAVEAQACIVGAVVVQSRCLLGLIGCP